MSFRGDEFNQEDVVEVDRISFTSFSNVNSDEEDVELYMSAGQSPQCSGDVNNSINEGPFVSVESSENLNDSFIQQSSPNDDEYSFDSCIPDISDVLQLADTITKAPLPTLLIDEPNWKELETKLRSFQTVDTFVSTDQEKANRDFYVSALTTAAVEELHWLNAISEDPELSTLVHELDPQFPLAMLHQANGVQNGNNGNGYAHSPEKNGNAPEAEAMTNGTTYESRRNGQPTTSHMASSLIKTAFANTTIHDERLQRWLSEFTEDIENFASATTPALSRQSTNLSLFEASTSSASLPTTTTVLPVEEFLRDQWIFTVSKCDTVRNLLEQQMFKCYECGVKIEKEKRVRFCDYYGKLFCHCCHQGLKTIIPARVLHSWNFTEFPVCDSALRFLNDVRDKPELQVMTIEPNLVEKIRLLKQVMQLRLKLYHMWEVLKECPLAQETVTSNGHLCTMFSSLQRHLLSSANDVFSLNDLVRVHNKDMSNELEPIAYYGKCHVESCKICRQRGTQCSVCSSSDLLFAFQLERVFVCSCGSLSHLRCIKRSLHACKMCEQPLAS